jgi:hypothetical protein
MAEVGKFLATFLHTKRFVSVLTKKTGRDYILGIFLQNHLAAPKVGEQRWASKQRKMACLPWRLFDDFE